MIVSEDLALAASAERLASLGLQVLLALQVGRVGAPLPHAKVERLALPVAEAPRVSRAQLLTDLLRGHCRRLHGGYPKTAVGSVLSAAGMARGDRAAFLATLPGLVERVVDGERLLFF